MAPGHGETQPLLSNADLRTAATGRNGDVEVDVDADDEDREGEVIKCRAVSPKVTALIIKRIKALVTKLLPIQVDPEELRSPTSSIITSEVIECFRDCAGDYPDCVPYCLLIARWWFHKEALRDPSDFDENEGRKLACEVLARRIVSRLPVARQHVVLSTRYTRIDRDGDESLPTSAIELACDQQATVFLSSSESQRTIFALWRGYLVQAIDERGHVVYAVYRQANRGAFLDHFDVSRLGVPRYLNFAKIILWVAFIVFYTIALQTPEREFGVEDVLLHIQVLGYTVELVTRSWKIFNASLLTFWIFVDSAIYTLFIVAFFFRCADLATTDPDKEAFYRLKAYQLISCAAPLIWAKLLTVFDTWPFFGTLQIVMNRMLRESAVFFALLILLAIGFAQGLVGLDLADSRADITEQVYHALLQGMLGSPVFDLFDRDTNGYPYSMILYYLWSIATLVILLNILVALFGSAYQDVVDQATEFYMTFFSQKTVTAVRAPDQYVFAAPFNLLEIFVVPFSWILTDEGYATLNRVVMRIVFFPTLCCIALYESRFERKRMLRFAQDMEADDDDEEMVEDPKMPPPDDQGHHGGEICLKSFHDLTTKFPDMTSSTTSATLKEVKQLKAQMTELTALVQQLLKQQQPRGGGGGGK